MAQWIAIIGTSGAGKTTLGRELARRIGGDFIGVDALAHKANWVNTTDEELCAGIDAAIVGTDQWVVDGTFRRRLGDFVTARTDLIVWLDLPLTTILPRLLRRTDYGVPRIPPPAELERYCEPIAALNVRTRNTQGRHLSTPEAIRLFEDYGIDAPEGRVVAPKSLLKKRTVNRYLARWGYDQRTLAIQQPVVHFQASYANECWQFDVSPSDLKALPEPSPVDRRTPGTPGPDVV